MSFYGDIKRVQSSPFVFDKYYPNRLTMDNSCASDNVYIGRYVLVKYTVKDEQDTSTSSPYFDKYVLDTQILRIVFLCKSSIRAAGRSGKLQF